MISPDANINLLAERILEHERQIDQLLDLVARLTEATNAVNDRIDRLESAVRRASDVASCLANGIQPD